MQASHDAAICLGYSTRASGQLRSCVLCLAVLCLLAAVKCPSLLLLLTASRSRSGLKGPKSSAQGRRPRSGRRPWVDVPALHGGLKGREKASLAARTAGVCRGESPQRTAPLHLYAPMRGWEPPPPLGLIAPLLVLSRAPAQVLSLESSSLVSPRSGKMSLPPITDISAGQGLLCAASVLQC